MHSIMKSFCMFTILAGYLVYGQMNSNNPSFRQSVVSRPVCANIGEYCQVASECCSKTCLSFSYRCVRSRASAALDEVPNIINSRLGGFDFRQCAKDGNYCQLSQECCSGSCLSFSYRCVGLPKQNVASQNSYSSVSDFFRSRQGLQNDQPQIIDARPPQIIASSGALCQAVNKQCNSTVSCCTFLSCSTTNNTCIADNTGFVVGTESLGETLANRFGEEEQQPVKLPNPECLELGAKCYNHEECCSVRCHSFLHQCVT